jgi:hypothetical protein
MNAKPREEWLVAPGSPESWALSKSIGSMAREWAEEPSTVTLSDLSP